MNTKVQHEFEGDVENGFYKCARCGGAESIHEFGPWDEAEGADLAAIVNDRLFEQEPLDEDEDSEFAAAMIDPGLPDEPLPAKEGASDCTKKG